MNREIYRTWKSKAVTSSTRLHERIKHNCRESYNDFKERYPRVLDWIASDVYMDAVPQPDRSVMPTLKEIIKEAGITNLEKYDPTITPEQIVLLASMRETYDTFKLNTARLLAILNLFRETGKLDAEWNMIAVCLTSFYVSLPTRIFKLLETRTCESMKELHTLIRFYMVCNILPNDLIFTEEAKSYETLSSFMKSFEIDIKDIGYEEMDVDKFIEFAEKQFPEDRINFNYAEDPLHPITSWLPKTTLPEITLFMDACLIDSMRWYSQVALYTLENENKNLERDYQSCQTKVNNLTRKLETQKKKTEELNAKLNAKQKAKKDNKEQLLKEENEKLKKEIQNLLNDNEKLKSRLTNVETQLEDTKRTNRTLTAQIAQENTQTIQALNNHNLGIQTPSEIINDTPSEITLEEKIDFLKELDLLILGGPANFSSKIKSFLPKAKVIDRTAKFNEIRVGNPDAVLIYSKVLGHARVYNITAQLGDTKSYYVSSTNKERFCNEVYNLLTK